MVPSEANDLGRCCFGPYHNQIGGKAERQEIVAEEPVSTVLDSVNASDSGMNRGRTHNGENIILMTGFRFEVRELGRFRSV